MAGNDDEIALLHAMQQGQQEGMALGEGAENNGEEEQNTEEQQDDSDQIVKEEPNLDTDDHVLRAPSATSYGGGEYNPAAINTLAPGGSDVASGSNTPLGGVSKRPKTIGGFVDSDDEDEDLSKPAQSHVKLPTEERGASKSPLHLQGIPESQINSSAPTSAVSTSAADPSFHAAPNTGESTAPRVKSESVALAQGSSKPKARLSHDRIGILEDRISEDPRGDINAWRQLIDEHMKKNKLEEARDVFERFFKVFPMSADMWAKYAEMELSYDNYAIAENIFGRSIISVPNINLWTVYLNYVRRRQDLTNDPTGAARNVVNQAYDFVLANIGMDIDAGKIWTEYIQFIKSAPGAVGGTTWQDQQKMDQMRKAYHKTVGVPTTALTSLWREYEYFEMGLNKAVGRKYIQERQPFYITARTAFNHLESMVRDLDRTNMPRLPPAPAFDGHEEYMRQVEQWKKWISWEQEDPLVLRDEDLVAYRKRIIYTYKQAIMALRFWPEMWIEAAEWCFINGMEKEGNEFLDQGCAANPESCLLAFKKADRLETVLPIEESDEGIAERGKAVRDPYDRCLDASYELLKKVKSREALALGRIEDGPEIPTPGDNTPLGSDEDDEDEETRKKNVKKTAIEGTKKIFAVQFKHIQRTLSFVWIALMRAMRRVQGKGKVGATVGGSRQILNDARLRGKITSDVYVASALIEHTVYKDPAGTKIFERGAKLFPEDEVFLLEYLKHLLSIGDTTNARAVFETSVNRLTNKPESKDKARPLYNFFHKYESDFGELTQIAGLEKRMVDLWPEDPKLERWTSRFKSDGFEPTATAMIVSPATQMKPKLPPLDLNLNPNLAPLGGPQGGIMRSVEDHIPLPPQTLGGNAAGQGSGRVDEFGRELSARPQYVHLQSGGQRDISPRPTYAHLQNQQAVQESPPNKRGYDDGPGPAPSYGGYNDEPPRKLARGESPLKGAAGRRLNQQRQAPQQEEFKLPTDVRFLLSIVPSNEDYARSSAPLYLDPLKLVDILRRTRIPTFDEWKAKGGLMPGARYLERHEVGYGPQQHQAYSQPPPQQYGGGGYGYPPQQQYGDGGYGRH